MRNSRLAYLFNPTLITCALMIGASMSASSAKAQSDSIIGTVNVPFTFHIGKQAMPAGMYRIQRQSNHGLRIRGENQSAFVLVQPAMSGKAPSRGYVNFHRYEDTYFLAEVWTAGDNYGMECAKSRTEEEMIRASNKRAPSLTALTLNSATLP
jgi:hypothetical protein